MPDLKHTVASSLNARYEKVAGVLRDLANSISDEQFWAKPFPFGNSFGHLVLHLTGNLNYYIGAQIAESGYVRDRPLEFTEKSKPAKSVVMKNFDQAVAMVVKTITRQSEEDWSKAYQAVGSDENTRLAIALVCASHLDHHAGQAIYLCFAVKQ